MTNQQHPITPPQELVEELQDLGNLDAIQLAYQAGADQELEECLKWVSENCRYYDECSRPEDKLRPARRPKPPSLREQALHDLEALEKDLKRNGMGFGAATIRRALEALPND